MATFLAVIIGLALACGVALYLCARILDKSNNYYAFVNVTFLDDYSEEYVLIYDDINTHSYLNCVTLALYESINGKIT